MDNLVPRVCGPSKHLPQRVQKWDAAASRRVPVRKDLVDWDATTACIVFLGDRLAIFFEPNKGRIR